MIKHHYFLNIEHNQNDYFTFSDYFLNEKYTFNSCSDIFSKDCIDYGTSVLLKTVINNLKLNGTVLDVGCGYGVIGIILKKYFPSINVVMLDINKTAVQLTKENCILNNVDAAVLESNLYDKIDTKVSHIVTNPPIKAGKENLFNVVSGAFNILENNGTITLVIKKKHGMESLKNFMNQTFGNVQILKRDSGYYILHSVKTNN